MITSAAEVEQITTCRLRACRGQLLQSLIQTGSRVFLRERASFPFSVSSVLLINFPQPLQFCPHHLAAGLFLCNHLRIHNFLLGHSLKIDNNIQKLKTQKKNVSYRYLRIPHIYHTM